MRGINLWPIVEAEVLSCEQVENDETTYYVVCFTFIAHREIQYGKFRPSRNGLLFARGDRIAIQYDSSDPANFVYPHAWTEGEKLLFAAIAVGVILLAHWIYTGSLWFQSSGSD